jgi:hypothetical protein
MGLLGSIKKLFVRTGKTIAQESVEVGQEARKAAEKLAAEARPKVQAAAKRVGEFGADVVEGAEQAVKKVTKKPAAKKPAVKKPAAKKPAAKKPAAKKPAAKPAAKKPAAKKPAAKKPAAKPAAKKPAAKK